MDFLYNFIDSEELCKIPADIKNRFAKLTLSKKKKLRKSLEANLTNQEKSPQCKKLSKKILSEIMTDDSSENEAEELNKIFQSSSSPDKNSVNIKSFSARKFLFLDSDETYCSQLEGTRNANMTQNMEKLQFSGEENLNENNEKCTLDTLSQQISNLGIRSPEKSQIVSVESERMSLNKLEGSSEFPELRFKTESIIKNDFSENVQLNIETKEETILNFSSITISSTVTDSIQSEESGVEGESDEEEVIVVTDSDSSSRKESPPKKPRESSDNFSEQVSEIRASGQTFLPSTMSNDKADRLEAFLRDLPGPGEQFNSYYDNVDIHSNITPHSEVSCSNEKSLYEESIVISETSTEAENKHSSEGEIIEASFVSSDNNENKSEEANNDQISNNYPNIEDPSTLSHSNEKNDYRNIKDQTTLSYSTEKNDYPNIEDPSTLSHSNEKNDNRNIKDQTTLSYSTEKNDYPNIEDHSTTSHSNDKNDYTNIEDHSTLSHSNEKNDYRNIKDQTTLSHSPEKNDYPNIEDHSTSSHSIDKNDSEEVSASNKKNESQQSSPDEKNSNSSSSIQYEKISISAKFNIKIKINSPNIVFTTNIDSPQQNNSDNSCDKNTRETNQSEIFQENQKAITPVSFVEKIPNDESIRKDEKRLCQEPKKEKFNDSKETKLRRSDKKKSEEDDLENRGSFKNINEKAKEILTKLYGTQWQTPENLKKLDKTATSWSSDTPKIKNTSKNTLDVDKIEFSINNKQNIYSEPEINPIDENIPDVIKDVENSIANEKEMILTHKNLDFQTIDLKSQKENHDESSIADFFTFHKDINRDLESTRLHNKTVLTEKVKDIKAQNENFKIPTTGKKIKKVNASPKFIKPASENTKYTRSGRQVKTLKWRQLKNDNSSDEDFSDDSQADATYQELKNTSLVSSDSSASSGGSYTKNFRKIKNKNTSKRRKQKKEVSKDDEIVYLDLTDEVIKIQENCTSPPAAHDPRFNEKLNSLLKTCTYEPKKQLEVTPILTATTTTKRKLFTPNFGCEDEVIPPDSPLREIINDSDEIKLTIPLPSMFGMPINKKLESVKTGTPIFKLPTPNRKRETPTSNKELKENNFKTPTSTTPKSNKTPRTPISRKKKLNDEIVAPIPEDTPLNKYGFLRSLDVMVPKSRCHPDSLIYRENYKAKKEELAEKLYKLYNEKLFKNELQVEIVWNKKLINTAGRCSNKKKGNLRTSVIELSEKVLTSADRLRCTLIHELCHAATWIFNGEHGHGATWKAWAHKANTVFQELPKIGVCHTYDIEYKYTYKCILCQAKSHAHSKSKKVENIRCAYCHGAIEIYINKKDKEGNIIPTPTKEPTGFAKFVKENYKNFKKPNLKHADIMKLLSSEFATLKVSDKK